jgi:hypothetical protein
MSNSSGQKKDVDNDWWCFIDCKIYFIIIIVLLCCCSCSLLSCSSINITSILAAIGTYQLSMLKFKECANQLTQCVSTAAA